MRPPTRASYASSNASHPFLNLFAPQRKAAEALAKREAEEKERKAAEEAKRAEIMDKNEKLKKALQELAKKREELAAKKVRARLLFHARRGCELLCASAYASFSCSPPPHLFLKRAEEAKRAQIHEREMQLKAEAARKAKVRICRRGQALQAHISPARPRHFFRPPPL